VHRIGESLTPERRIVERIRREGPIPFDAFVDEALYGDGGFFAEARGAGRAGSDFVTSPEIGTLFGALVARAIDRYWEELGAPDPFVVVDAGAGRGRLAADVLAASPRCAPALRYVLVERSEALRGLQRELLSVEPVEDALGPILPGDEDTGAAPVTGLGPIVTSLGELPAVPFSGVVLANELLDNLPFRLVERSPEGWKEIRVAESGGAFAEELVPASDELRAECRAVAPDDVPAGTRLPVPTGARRWLRDCASVLDRGALVVVDYAEPVAEFVVRGTGWLRTYRGHAHGGPPLADVGAQDVTSDLPLEYVVHAAARVGLVLASVSTQADWLRDLGISELVDDARRGWDERAHVGDLEALRHRSRVAEAPALLDPTGLGAHRVLVFRPA
jgi:SAM-dependent MidA family methyltransferase